MFAIFFAIVIKTSLLSQKNMPAGRRYTKATGKMMCAITGTKSKQTQPMQKYTKLAFFMKASIPHKNKKCYTILHCFV